MIRLLRLLRCARGTATIEFALCSLFLFGTITVALDFGVYNQQKLKLGQAVEAGAIMAYNNKVADSSTTATAIQGISNYIRDFSGTKVQPTVQIYCNSATDKSTANCAGGRCSCLTAAGGFGAVGDCTTPRTVCTSGGVEGTYMKIVATIPYTAMVVPDRYLGGTTITQSTVLRLK